MHRITKKELREFVRKAIVEQPPFATRGDPRGGEWAISAQDLAKMGPHQSKQLHKAISQYRPPAPPAPSVMPPPSPPSTSVQRHAALPSVPSQPGDDFSISAQDLAALTPDELSKITRPQPAPGSTPFVSSPGGETQPAVGPPQVPQGTQQVTGPETYPGRPKPKRGI